MAIFIAGDATGGVNFDNLDLGALLDGTYVQRTSTLVSISSSGGFVDNFFGSGFTYNAQDIPSGGTVTRYQQLLNGQVIFDLTGVNVPATQVVQWAMTGNNYGAMEVILGGADSIQGSNFGDLIGGFGGADTIMGGNGADSIAGMDGANYLRGDAGNDVLVGGANFDDINGNMGDDTASGGEGADWVVGGKDQDMLSGSGGDDIVYGNLGNDSCLGGVGNDLVRGGQDQDLLFGEGGNDWMSGDRGSDTISGGAGADIFHSFGEAGIDVVTDFNRAEGDRVQVERGTTYTVSQSGADTVIDMGGGNRMVLQNVQSSTLTGDWIFSL